MKTKTRIDQLFCVLGVIVALGWTGLLMARDHTDSHWVNLQGVLRDNNGNPLNGSFDMTFRFFDAAAGGNEILIDEHLSAGTGNVTVSGGLFNVALGSGNLLDGSGPGTFVRLSDVFGNVEAVYLEIQASGEVLSPRIGMRSAGSALNADHLDGKDAAEFLDTSGAAQTKAGDLSVGGSISVDEDLTLSDGSVLRAARPDPPCFGLSNRFEDCLNGTVTDTVTGLIWLEDASCPALGGQQLWMSANQAAVGLSDGTCGLTDNSSAGDWRLPTKDEWQMIVDQANTNGCSFPGPFVPDTLGLGCWSEGDPFSGVQSDRYWSSTSIANNPSSAWSAILDFGGVSSNRKTSINGVWPVRGGP